MADTNISLNAQIVLYPNINDGKELDNTYPIYPHYTAIKAFPWCLLVSQSTGKLAKGARV